MPTLLKAALSDENGTDTDADALTCRAPTPGTTYCAVPLSWAVPPLAEEESVTWNETFAVLRAPTTGSVTVAGVTVQPDGAFSCTLTPCAATSESALLKVAVTVRVAPVVTWDGALSDSPCGP